MKILIRTVKVYKTLFMTKLRLLRENWEWYMVYITAQQAKRGYLRFRRPKTKEETPKKKWQKELDKEELKYPSDSQFTQMI